MEAIYFGTFAPFHKGHAHMVIYGKRHYEHLHLVCSGSTNDRGDKANMPLFDRFRTLREIYNEDEIVTVYHVNEDNITPMPNGWKEWLDILASKIPDLKSKVFICSEEQYEKELVNRGYKVDLYHRNDVVVSATRIRENPYQNWDYINKYFKKFFTKKVLVYGTASTGKTTLTKDLASYFNTSFSLEYAREYELECNVLDEELDIRDLTNIGIGQFNQNKKHINSPACNKIFIADTDVMTTANYLHYYNKEDSHYSAVENIFSGLIEKQKWDLILFLQPDTQYVDDGFRDMAHSKQSVRDEFNDLFEANLKKHHLEYVKLSGDFYTKYKTSIELIEALIEQ